MGNVLDGLCKYVAGMRMLVVLPAYKIPSARFFSVGKASTAACRFYLTLAVHYLLVSLHAGVRSLWVQQQWQHQSNSS